MIIISSDGQAVAGLLPRHRTLFSAVKQGFFELVDSPRDKRKVAEVPKFAYILAYVKWAINFSTLEENYKNVSPTKMKSH